MLQVVEALRHLGLAFQFFKVGVQFAQDVFHTRQVFAGVAQAVFGLAAAFFVLGNACGLLQKQTQFFGLGFNDAADRALANDGVSAWTQTSAQEHILHITAAHRLVVDVVAAGAVAGQDPLDGDLGELAPLAARTVAGVVKHQFDTGAAGGFAAGGAIEDDVLHGLATQFAGTALTQHPSHGINDVGLATAVGADHAHQLTGQHEIGGVCKGFEARQLDGIKTHRKTFSSRGVQTSVKAGTAQACFCSSVDFQRVTSANKDCKDGNTA